MYTNAKINHGKYLFYTPLKVCYIKFIRLKTLYVRQLSQTAIKKINK